MIDSINKSGAGAVQQRAQSVQQNNALRNNPALLNSIIGAQQKASNATAAINTALAVPQSAKSGGASNVKLPRGSLIDVIA